MIVFCICFSESDYHVRQKYIMLNNLIIKARATIIYAINYNAYRIADNQRG